MLQLRPDLLPVMFEHAWATDKMSKPNLVINNNNEQARTPQAPPPPDRKKFCVRRSRMYTYAAHSRCTLLGLMHSIAAHSKRMRHARVIVDDNGREHAPLHLALGCAHARSLRSAAVEHTHCALHREQMRRSPLNCCGLKGSFGTREHMRSAAAQISGIFRKRNYRLLLNSAKSRLWKSSSMPNKSEAPQDAMLTIAATARLLALSSERVRQLVREGWIARGDNGRIRLSDAVQGYIRFLKDGDRRSSKQAAELAVRMARAQEIQIRTQQRLHRLVDVEEAIAVVEDITGKLLTEVLSFPAIATRDLTLRRHLDEVVHDMRNRLAAYCELQATSLQATGKATTGHIAGQAAS